MTVADARRAAETRLGDAGMENAALDARLLLQAATGLDAAALAADPDRALTVEEAARFEAMLARRAAREPLSHILGRTGFWTLDLTVTPDVLTPRPDSETVVEAALEETRGVTGGRVLDLGVGSGALLLAFLSERPGWRGVGVDASEAALGVARANAAACGLADRAGFVCADWDTGLAPDAAFDLVLSNPPYVAAGEIETLAPEVRDHEPHAALNGGADGLDAYRRIVPQLGALLARGGVAALEIGATQAEDVAALIRAALPDARVRVAADLAGRPRAAIARRQS